MPDAVIEHFHKLTEIYADKLGVDFDNFISMVVHFDAVGEIILDGVEDGKIDEQILDAVIAYWRRGDWDDPEAAPILPVEIGIACALSALQARRLAMVGSR